MRAIFLVDTQEKKALPLPAFLRPYKGTTVRCEIQRQRLPTADYTLAGVQPDGYALQGAPRSIVVETKRSLRELAENVLTASGERKFRDVLRRMRDNHDEALLIIEGGLSTLYDARQADRLAASPAVVLDSLLPMLIASGISYVLVPEHTPRQRLLTADFVARWLLHCSQAPLSRKTTNATDPVDPPARRRNAATRPSRPLRDLHAMVRPVG